MRKIFDAHKKKILLAMTVGLFALPLVASAVTIDDLKAQLAQVLSELAALQGTTTTAVADAGGSGIYICQIFGGCPSPSQPSTCPIQTLTCALGYHTQQATTTDANGCSNAPTCVEDSPAVAAAAAISPAHPSCLVLSDTLSIGMSGDSVMKLQNFLVSEHYLDPSFATGFFGSLTQAAVEKWQADNGVALPSNPGYGTVGPRTRAAIQTNSCTAGSQAGGDGDVHATLTFEGVSRTYILHIPANYSASKSYPLMMIFHGDGGSGAGMEQKTQFDPIADQEGFFVAYPDAVGAKWVLTGSNNDEVFNLAVLNDIERAYSIDKARVYISGYSQGGGMVTQLACDYTGTFAGAATISENFDPTTEANCHPSRPITFVLFHGTADPLSPYDGGTNPLSGGTIYSAQNTAQFWADNNGCFVGPTTQLSDILNTGTTTTDTKQAWTGCNAGARVILYTIAGGGHTWPGSATGIGQSFNSIALGPVSQDLHASQLIWQTMSQ